MRNQGKPVNIVEIWQSCELSSQLHSTKFKMVLLDLVSQSEIYTDETVTLFSTSNDSSGHRAATDGSLEEDTALESHRMLDVISLMSKKYPGYKFDDIFRVVPGPSTDTINFTKLQALLLSKEHPVESLEE